MWNYPRKMEWARLSLYNRAMKKRRWDWLIKSNTTMSLSKASRGNIWHDIILCCVGYLAHPLSVSSIWLCGVQKKQTNKSCKAEVSFLINEMRIREVPDRCCFIGCTRVSHNVYRSLLFSGIALNDGQNQNILPSVLLPTCPEVEQIWFLKMPCFVSSWLSYAAISNDRVSVIRHTLSDRL